MQTRKRLLIFTGAGFSASMSESLLITADFHKKHILGSRYANDERFEYIDSRLDPTDKDAESFARRLADAIAGIKLLADDGSQLSLSGQGYSFGGAAEGHKEHFEGFLKHINTELLSSLDCVTPPPDTKEPRQHFKKFLAKLKEGFDFNIFSTNYDNLFNHILPSPRYYLNDLNEIDLIKLTSDHAPYSYVPLKGRLDWNYSDGKLVQHIKRSTDLKNAFIIPLEWTLNPEEHSHGNDHMQLYQKFDIDLKTSSVLLFIGFSFRDKYINEMLSKYTFDKILIVTRPRNPAEQEALTDRLKTQVFSKNQKNMHILENGFDAKMQNEILRILS